MSEDLKIKKQALRAEAKRARGLLSLDLGGYNNLCNNFFDNIDITKDTVIAAYWAKERELDVGALIDKFLEIGANVSLPVIEKGSKILKFAKYDNNIDLVEGAFGIAQPVIDENTKWLEPDIFLLPLLAFDRKGNRLGFGGGYYDATLSYYKSKKPIIAVGMAYAQQACLFNLPVEDHDIKMDWVVTEQSAVCFD